MQDDFTMQERDDLAGDSSEIATGPETRQMRQNETNIGYAHLLGGPEDGSSLSPKQEAVLSLLLMGSSIADAAGPLSAAV